MSQDGDDPEDSLKRKSVKNSKEKIIIDDVPKSVVVIVFAIWIFFGGYAIYKTVKKHQIEKQVQQYEQSLPNYQEYQETVLRIQNYRDSLMETNGK